MSEFDDIRPYNDAEVQPTLARLLNDPEFLDTLARLKMPNWLSWARFAARPWVRMRLKKEMQGIDTVFAFQQRIAYYLSKLLDKTMTGLTISGLEQLDRHTSYCFISNHRDIAMDPAFVNWVLFNGGYQTLRIAIGDNLLTKPFASEIMRLNKSFIVNRSATSPREKLKAAKHLSHYIQHSILDDKSNIWIAQREGRAKDSLDKTNPAIISMLALHRPKANDFGEYIAATRIVPVSISYEFDPCDTAKARELTLKATHGSYQKGAQEDVQSIASGLSGFKGAVHLTFGQPLDNRFNSVEEVAAHLDREILTNYVLHPANCIAYEILENQKPNCVVTHKNLPYAQLDTQELRRMFLARLETCDPQFRDIFLKIYANPVYAKLALANSDAG